MDGAGARKHDTSRARESQFSRPPPTFSPAHPPPPRRAAARARGNAPLLARGVARVRSVAAAGVVPSRPRPRTTDRSRRRVLGRRAISILDSRDPKADPPIDSDRRAATARAMPIKHKLKQWLADNDPSLAIKPERDASAASARASSPPGSPKSTTPPLREVRSIHWSPYDRVRVVNADP